MAWGQQQTVNIEDEELKDFKKLSWSDFINLTLMRILKSDNKDSFALEVDKLESVMRVDLPSDYYDELSKLSEQDSKRPYAWRKFDLLLVYVRKRTPKEVEGTL